MVHSLYLEIGEGSEAKIFTGQRKARAEHFVNVSASDSIYYGRYDSSKSGFQYIPGRITISRDTKVQIKIFKMFQIGHGL